MYKASAPSGKFPGLIKTTIHASSILSALKLSPAAQDG
jgi:hypothetical protein